MDIAMGQSAYGDAGNGVGVHPPSQLQESPSAPQQVIATSAGDAAPAKWAYPAPSPVAAKVGLTALASTSTTERVFCPSSENPWKVRLRDLDTRKRPF
jgi:hypothetical protein